MPPAAPSGRRWASVCPGRGATRLEPFVTAAVEFAGNADWTTSANFVGESGAVDPFAVSARSPGFFGRFGVGAELASGPNFALVLKYTPEFGSHCTTKQGVVQLTYRF